MSIQQNGTNILPIETISLIRTAYDERSEETALVGEGVGEHKRTSVHSRTDIALIDDRVLLRECFARSLQMIEEDLSVRHFSSLEHFDVAACAEHFDIIIMCKEWRKSRSAEFLRQIAAITSGHPDIHLIVMSDIDDFEEIVAVIEAGARGFIPTSVRLEVALQAMHLIKAGGVYVPAGVLLWSRRIIKEMSQAAKQQTDTTFTPRQQAVAEALRRGKANKLIAYELNMCESTVKVHIRSIMKKLRARNRTEASFIMNKQLNGEDVSNENNIDNTISW